MSDQRQRDAMRKWPTHEEHGEPGFVTCRHGILIELLDELRSAETDRDRYRHELECTSIRLRTCSPGVGFHYNRAELSERIAAALNAGEPMNAK